MDGERKARHRNIFITFMLGGSCSAAATFCTHPIDTVKIRLQLDNQLSGKTNIFKDRYYKGIVRGMLRIVKEESFKALFQGTTASMIREMTYTTIRAGAYEPIKRTLGGVDRRNTDLRTKLLAGMGAGLLGSGFTTPTDIIKVRLQADGLNNTPRVYRGTIHCFQVIVRDHGLRGLFTGATPNMIRACCLNAMQFPVYDHTKHTIMNYKLLDEGYVLHFISAMVAGLAAAVATNPADIVKTRIMNQKKHENNFKSPMDTFIKTVRSEGPLGLLKGTTASWARLGPGITLYFIIYEQARHFFGIHPI